MSVAENNLLVVDPDDAVWVFRVIGRATLRTIDEIDRLTARLGAVNTVHVDLHDAVIPSGAVMRELERMKREEAEARSSAEQELQA